MWKRRPANQLTAREREVLDLLKRGLTNEEIAQRLHVSVAGAKYHVSQILSKLGVNTREEAAYYREPRKWLQKLVWIAAAGAVVAALTGIVLALFDSGKNVTDESGVFAEHSISSVASSPAAGQPNPSTASSSSSPRPDAGQAVTSPRPVTAPTGSPLPTPIPTPTRTPAATPSGSPTPVPTASPGGSGKIAFVRGPIGDIYVMTSDGSGRTAITSGPEEDRDPAWSPDGTKIALTRESGMTWTSDILIANADGSGETNLTNSFGWNSHPAWSPDGSRIAFLKFIDYPRGVHFWVMTADGTGATRILGSPDVVPEALSWSPDGYKIAFGSGGGVQYDIYSVNVDGGNPAGLTTGPEIDAQPAWSPDGTRIAFARWRGGDYEIWLMNADGSNQLQLTYKGGSWPAWSPDGSKIAFTRGQDFRRHQEIYVIDVDGTNETNLTNSASVESDPDWQPLPPSPTLSAEPSVPSVTKTLDTRSVRSLTHEPAVLSLVALPIARSGARAGAIFRSAGTRRCRCPWPSR